MVESSSQSRHAREAAPVSLSALPTALLVPPVSLLPVCLAGLVVIRRRPRLGLALLASGIAGLLLLATPLVSGALVASLEGGLPLAPPPGNPPQAIVILSADAARDGGTVPVAGALTLERERAGAALFRRTGLPVLVTGGSMRPGEASLAAVMASSLADDFAVPVRWVEPEAQDTWENAADSAAILEAKGIRSIYVVTHAWHMRRALIAFARAGMVVTAAPVRLDTGGAVLPSDLVPRAGAWLDSYWALHEWIGCADYALFR